MVIKRINPISAGKVCGVLYAVLGLIIGGFFALISMVAGGAASMTGDDSGGGMMGMMFGVGAIIILPIFYGIGGFIGGIIMGALYNLAAKFAGGIEFETQ